MQNGRVPLAARQWMNFGFLICLLSLVGFFTWQQSQVEYFEVPEGHAVVYSKKSLFSLPWSKPKITVVTAGRYPLGKGGAEDIKCLPLGIQEYEFKGQIDSTSSFQSLASVVGLGTKSSYSISGKLTLFVDEQALKKLFLEKGEDYSEAIGGLLTTATANHIKLASKPDEFLSATRDDLSWELEKVFGIKIQEFNLLETENLKGESAKSFVSAYLVAGQMVPPSYIKQMPLEGYLSIAVALLVALFVYGLVRVLFAELIALLIFLPLSALGFDSVPVKSAGYYPSPKSRRRRSKPKSFGFDPGLPADVVGTVVDGVDIATSMADHGHSVGDAIGTASDAVEAFGGLGHAAESLGGIGDAAEALGGIAEAGSAFFEGLGAIGDIF